MNPATLTTLPITPVTPTVAPRPVSPLLLPPAITATPTGLQFIPPATITQEMALRAMRTGPYPIPPPTVVAPVVAIPPPTVAVPPPPTVRVQGVPPPPTVRDPTQLTLEQLAAMYPPVIEVLPGANPTLTFGQIIAQGSPELVNEFYRVMTDNSAVTYPLSLLMRYYNAPNYLGRMVPAQAQEFFTTTIPNATISDFIDIANRDSAVRSGLAQLSPATAALFQLRIAPNGVAPATQPIAAPAVVALRPQVRIFDVLEQLSEPDEQAFLQALDASVNGQRFFDRIAMYLVLTWNTPGDLRAVKAAFSRGVGSNMTVQKLVTLANTDPAYRVALSRLPPSVLSQFGILVATHPQTVVAVPPPTRPTPGLQYIQPGTVTQEMALRAVQPNPYTVGIVPPTTAYPTVPARPGGLPPLAPA